MTPNSDDLHPQEFQHEIQPEFPREIPDSFAHESHQAFPEELRMEPVAEESGSSDQLKRRVYFGFAGCVALGLAVAGMYISGRLFAKPKDKSEPVAVSKVEHAGGLPKASPLDLSKKVEKDAPKPDAAPVAESAAPAEEAKPAAVPHEEPKSEPTPAAKPQLVSATTPPLVAGPAGIASLINPKTGDRYLQLAALGPGYTDKYVASLAAKGIHATVAAGPTEHVYRVLVGPFADQGSLERQHDALEAAGIHPMLRVY